MAASLPRYEDAGVRYGQVSFQNTAGAQAAAQADNVLADNISRLTSFAFSQAEAQAKVEGLEYGAANAPTVDQLKRAQETGQAVALPGDTSSVFGRSANAAALDQMQRNVEIDARQKMSELFVTAKTQQMPALEFQKNLQDLIDGYGSSMSKVSPMTAGSLRASLSTVASSHYVSYADWMLQKETARQKIGVESGIDTVIESIPSLVKTGDTTTKDADGNDQTVTLDQRLAGERTKILRWSLSVNDPSLAESSLKKFTEAVKKAKVNSIVEWTNDWDGVPSIEKYNAVMFNNVEDPRVKQMWDSLSEEDKASARKEMQTRMGAQLELDSKINAANERTRHEQQANNRVDFVKAWQSGDTNGQRTALNNMQRLYDAEGYEKYSTVVGTRNVMTEQGLMLTLENELTRGTLNNERVMQLVKERRLSDTDARALLPKIETAATRDMTEALTVVKNALGYPDRPIINASAADRRAMQQVAEINNAMIAAKRVADLEGKQFNAYDFAQRQIKEKQASGPSAADINAAEQQLIGIKKLLALPDTATLDQTRDALSAAVANKKFNDKQAGPYFDSIKLLKNNGGQ